MRIGIIGAGHIGGTLARRFTALGHEVHIANSRGPQTLKAIAAETGAIPGTAAEMPKDADLVVVTIPMKSVPNLPRGLFADAPEDQVVIDTCNYYPQQRDGLIAPIEAGMTESRWVEQEIGHPVIKAFNNIIADHLLNDGKPAGARGRIALPIAGDDEDAKAVVMNLVNDLGFDAVDDGGLDDSWRQQPGQPVYTTDLDAEGVQRALSEARETRTPAWMASSKQSTGARPAR